MLDDTRQCTKSTYLAIEQYRAEYDNKWFPSRGAARRDSTEQMALKWRASVGMRISSHARHQWPHLGGHAVRA